MAEVRGMVTGSLPGAARIRNIGGCMLAPIRAYSRQKCGVAPMLLRVRSITYLAEAINGYELVDPRGRDLPRFSAGSHIAVRLGGGLLRDYSLCNDPAERRHYRIAVLRERDGEGSRQLHETARVGDPVEV